ncbi:disease resistance protein RGA2-like [Oryza sativa Japonica Group]|uniref:disease resistance protein RGA2-like n=1 Tax=Oryza sativa subsp. japonica TaxID=39947 RepID=UPI000E1C1503|nr:disease resistance protein RGA2-like [Oryza sativa Japonica Group]XP_025876939.1 disease resistance protein RGA2-like [Oryza sativa Japonica Group]XP_025876940.1 disease resistance protein RGA2-like [Oryza sativa Japonica Group]
MPMMFWMNWTTSASMMSSKAPMRQLMWMMQVASVESLSILATLLKLWVNRSRAFILMLTMVTQITQELKQGSMSTCLKHCGACCCSPNPGRDRANEAPMHKFDRVGISTRMKHITEQLQPICAKVSVILNMEMLGSKSNTQDSTTSQRITISESVDPKLYGRNKMKDKIIRDITNGIYAEQDLSVLSLFGPGGIGKTTLVQYIYNNQEVHSHFQATIWVCVSFNFNVSMLIQQIKDQIPEVDGENGTAEDHIEQRLKSKRFLLILDDMWKCDGEDMWKRLLVPFRKSQAKGNVVIVTTRFPALAEMVNTMDHPIELERLEQEEFMQLFEACVFGEAKALSRPEFLSKIPNAYICVNPRPEISRGSQ